MKYCRKLTVTIVSATNLPDVRMFGRMKVYAEVSINGKIKRTNVDKKGKTNPRWNFPIDYMVSESGVQNGGTNIVVKLFCKRTLGDRFIGEVKIQVKKLFDSRVKCKKSKSYRVEGSGDGKLNIRCSFGKKILVKKEWSWKEELVAGSVVLVTEAISAFVGDQYCYKEEDDEDDNDDDGDDEDGQYDNDDNDTDDEEDEHDDDNNDDNGDDDEDEDGYDDEEEEEDEDYSDDEY